jgi:bifunctional non-homologous end joining protein LigD
VSWALPKGVPLAPEERRLAVRVEDHPLDYATFSGTIPSGEYGAGEVSIWDRGTYRCETWGDREIKVVLDGARVAGRYVLFATRGSHWMIHRMDRPPVGFEPMPDRLAPMLAEAADALPEEPGRWAYEFKWDGLRALVRVEGGRARAHSRNGNDITAGFPEVQALAAALGSTRALLDGELVVFDHDQRPSFSLLQHRTHVSAPRRVQRVASQFPASLVVFDLLHLDGRPMLQDTYDQRRRALEGLHLGGPSWAVTPAFTDVPGASVLQTALDHGLEGVVAKRRTSHYRPGARGGDWVKVKGEPVQEVVVGGWTSGQGNRRDTFGALVLGVPTADTEALTYVGKVGTGFTLDDRRALLAELGGLECATSPFDADLPATVRRSGVTWVRPALVGEVRFREWTADGQLRQPVWRGLRRDKVPRDVRRES